MPEGLYDGRKHCQWWWGDLYSKVWATSHELVWQVFCKVRSNELGE